MHDSKVHVRNVNKNEDRSRYPFRVTNCIFDNSRTLPRQIGLCSYRALFLFSLLFYFRFIRVTWPYSIIKICRQKKNVQFKRFDTLRQASSSCLIINVSLNLQLDIHLSNLMVYATKIVDPFGCRSSFSSQTRNFSVGFSLFYFLLFSLFSSRFPRFFFCTANCSQCFAKMLGISHVDRRKTQRATRLARISTPFHRLGNDVRALCNQLFVRTPCRVAQVSRHGETFIASFIYNSLVFDSSASPLPVDGTSPARKPTRKLASAASTITLCLTSGDCSIPAINETGFFVSQNKR